MGRAKYYKLLYNIIVLRIYLLYKYIEKVVFLMKGKGLLKVVGILMIIGGAISIIMSIVAIAGVGALTYLADGDLSSAQLNPTIIYTSCVVMILGSVAELIAGIIGVKNCTKPEKATSCLVFGIIVAIFNLLGIIIGAVGGSGFNFMSLVTGLVLPVLFIVGAVMNKKSN